jgi:hypothetical protein
MDPGELLWILGLGMYEVLGWEMQTEVTLLYMYNSVLKYRNTGVTNLQ